MHYRVNAPGQTLSLAASLYEAAALLDAAEPALAAGMRRRAETYVRGFLAAPHDLQHGVFVLLCGRETNDVRRADFECIEMRQRPEIIREVLRL